MKSKNEILPAKNVIPKISEDNIKDLYFNLENLRNELNARLAEIRFEDIYCTEIVYKIVTEAEVTHIKALLREMRVRMLKPIGSVNRLKRILFSHVSLLFGMCCSQSSQIISAFFGNSLSRIPSL